MALQDKIESAWVEIPRYIDRRYEKDITPASGSENLLHSQYSSGQLAFTVTITANTLASIRAVVDRLYRRKCYGLDCSIKGS